MHLEVKVALNFIVSYLYNKLPRRRADLFGEELERILVARFEGHWYPEAPLRGSAFRCLHLGAPRDPVVELAAKRSGLDTEEVRANVPAELSVWIDPYEVSYQIGEKGTVKVLYLEDPPGLLGDGERPEGVMREGNADTELEEAKSLGFNPDAQVFVPIGSQLSPSLMAPLCASPTPPSAPTGPALFNYPTSTSPANPAAHSSNTSTPSPPTNGMPYLAAQQPAAAAAAAAASSLPATRPQPITFTTAAFAATKFGSTKMKKCSAAGSAGASGGGGGIAVAVGVPPVQRLLSHSPTAMLAPEMLPHKSLSLSMHSLVGPAPSQLSPNAKEFVYPGSLSPLYFDADPQPMPAAHASRFKPLHRAGTFDPFSSPPPSQSVGVMGANGEISYVEKPQFAEGLGSYNLQYPSQSFQPVVLAN